MHWKKATFLKNKIKSVNILVHVYEENILWTKIQTINKIKTYLTTYLNSYDTLKQKAINEYQEAMAEHQEAMPKPQEAMTKNHEAMT